MQPERHFYVVAAGDTCADKPPTIRDAIRDVHSEVRSGPKHVIILPRWVVRAFVALFVLMVLYMTVHFLSFYLYTYKPGHPFPGLWAIRHLIMNLIP